jgi:hypothetical protein
MGDTISPNPEGCPQYGEELPLLAVGSLDHDCAASLREHLSDCPGCRASYEAHCRVLETVRGELAPDRPLDTEGVLARLRERMGKASGSGTGVADRERSVKLFVSLALMVGGVLALLILTRPGDPVPSLTLPEVPDAALLYAARQPGGRRIEGGGTTALPSGRQASFSAKGMEGAPADVDVRKAFGWLSEELYKGLKLDLSVLPPTRVSLVLKNASSGPIGVTGYHPLGVNYQLEIRRPGSASPEFIKLVPSLLRVQRAPGVIEAVHETLGQIVIEPGQVFEIEMDLSALLSEPGTYRIAAEYLGFGPAGGGAAEQGLLLRSNEAQIVIAAPQPGSAPKK